LQLNTAGPRIISAPTNYQTRTGRRGIADQSAGLVNGPLCVKVNWCGLHGRSLELAEIDQDASLAR
jgi:hypothetical protein